MLKLFGTPNSRSTRVAWALEEVGAEYEITPIQLGRGGGRAPEYLAINPGGKVPALIDGDAVLTESAAIVLYLAERFPNAGLVPGDPLERARCVQWCFFVIGELEQPLWTMTKHAFVLPPKLRVPAILATAASEWKRAAAVLSTGLGERPYLLGDAFTAADIMVGHTLAWATAAQQPLEAENLVAYRDRVLARPALARAQAREQAAAG
ncbi:MAG: glutathione S-transferase family protein [Myxococcales bacterium]|nr:glutathione S-transferase family protein [Myxococcales bacterium]MCB9755085.1 glutathione S-transferase family protein [Myxococcales bacterium]